MEKFSFFNDIDDDRVYFAEDFARHLAKYFTNGIFNNELKVLANNDMTITIQKGDANIEGYRYTNTSDLTKAIDTADGALKRIDNVVIRLDLTNRLISAQIIKGTFSDKPSAPSLVRTSTIYDLRIAKIYVNAGITAITQDMIEDTRFNNNDCGNVVATVDIPDTTDLFLQFESKFNNWFNEIKNKLSGDIAGNLQNQITENKNTASNLQNQITTNKNAMEEYLSKNVVSKNLQKIDDVNLAIETGYYYTSTNTTNLPMDGSAGYLVCLYANSNTYTQFWIRYRDNQIWMRQHNLISSKETVASWKDWEKIKPNVSTLYSNLTGSTSSVTLSDDASNYNSIMIELTPKQYKNFLGVKHIAIVPKNGNFSDSTSWYNNENARMYTLLFNYTISNNKITITLNQGGSVGTDTAYAGEANVFAITKVVGFDKK